MRHDDPARGDWFINGSEINVGIDTISLATGVMLEKDEVTLEDAC